jgi:hypothetical protein
MIGSTGASFLDVLASPADGPAVADDDGPAVDDDGTCLAGGGRLHGCSRSVPACGR